MDNTVSPIRKYADYYYQITKIDGGYGYVVYNQYKPEGREVLYTLEDDTSVADVDMVADSPEQAESWVQDSIQCHYD